MRTTTTDADACTDQTGGYVPAASTDQAGGYVLAANTEETAA